MDLQLNAQDCILVCILPRPGNAAPSSCGPLLAESAAARQTMKERGGDGGRHVSLRPAERWGLQCKLDEYA